MSDIRAAILSFPWPLWEFLRFAEERSGDSAQRSHIMAMFRQTMRFQARDADVPHLVPGARVERVEEGGVKLVSELGEVTLADAEAGLFEAVLARIDGRRPAVDVVASPRVVGLPAWAALDRMVGWCVTLPDAVDALERRVPGIFVARFPTSPYTIERDYWSNMGDLWARRDELRGATRSHSAFGEFLRDLHVTAVMGAKHDCFYKPASPVPAHRIHPGSFDRGETWVGGGMMRSPYFKLLAGVHDDMAAFAPGYLHADDDGLVWATLRTVRTEFGVGPFSFFTRSVREEHLARLAGLLAAAQDATAPEEVSNHLAAFHQRFVQLHPFACANQCIAMALLNQVLETKLGGAIPHVHLDFVALLSSPAMYQRVFAQAVRQYLLMPRASDAYTLLREKVRVAAQFVERLMTCKGPGEALELVAGEPEAAALVLLSK